MMTASRLFCRRRASSVRGLVDSLEPRVLLSAQLVKDILPGSDGGQPTMLTAFGDKLVFATAGLAENHGLWVSDGTDAGTTRIFNRAIGRDAYESRPTIAT